MAETTEILTPAPVKKLLQGVEKPLKEVKSLTAVQFKGKNPVKSNDWQSYKLPKFMVIKNSKPIKTDKKLVSVEYASVLEKDFVHHTAILPADLALKELTGKKGVEIIKNYEFDLFTNKMEQGCNGPLTKCIGSDPEIFVEDENGIIIPAFKFLKSQSEPDKAPDDSNGHGGNKVYWDGFQAEFTTFSAECLSWQIDSIQKGLKGVYQKSKKFNSKAVLSTKTLIEVSQEELNTLDEKYVEFGCKPSFNAYGLKGDIANGGRAVPFRSAGGHIHFGFGKQTEEANIKIVKALDAILGVSCVSLFAKFDNPIRRQYYGLPGEFRTPPHGLEYRTLSNAWLFHPVIAHMVIDLSRKVVNFGYNDMLKNWKGSEEETIDTIFSCDVKNARIIMERNKSILIGLFKCCYNRHLDRAETAYNVFINGMESSIKDPTDIVGNWKLDKDWVLHSDGTYKNFANSADYLKKGNKI